MRTVAERVAKLAPNPAHTVLRSLWPLVVGLVIAWFLQQVMAPALGPLSYKPQGEGPTNPAARRLRFGEQATSIMLEKSRDAVEAGLTAFHSPEKHHDTR